MLTQRKLISKYTIACHLPALFSGSHAVMLLCAPLKASYSISFKVKHVHSRKEFFTLKKKTWGTSDPML